jgi:hypothetical protein
MMTELEFLDGIGLEGIAPSIEAYDGEVPHIGDLIHLKIDETWDPFRVVDRVFYLTSLNDKQKITLFCHPAETGNLGH